MQFLVTAYDLTDEEAPRRRLAVRGAHLALVKQMTDAGLIHIAAALLDDDGNMIGSVFICEFESRREIDDWFISEPYITGKVWGKIKVEPCQIGSIFLKDK
ncbi:MAG TPA: YciI family protein [Pyrinomonadaceae bacterium]|jgi:uncharacterized protein YciI